MMSGLFAPSRIVTFTRTVSSSRHKRSRNPDSVSEVPYMSPADTHSDCEESTI